MLGKLVTCLASLLLLLGAMDAAPCSTDEEVLLWQAADSWPAFPEHIIMCPLDRDLLHRTYYSLDRVEEAAMQPGQPYRQQEEAMEAFLEDPPLTKVQGKKVRMAPLEPTSIEIRRAELSKFVGFLVLYLHQLPSMQHVMQPMLVSKYMGFLQARGLAWNTIKKVRGCLHVHAASGHVHTPSAMQKQISDHSFSHHPCPPDLYAGSQQSCNGCDLCHTPILPTHTWVYQAVHQSCARLV